ncbi:hypothetical protein GJ496_002257 [Pomphorhynchus laevis]|nr:hypothetical protein GJ496_002257 [Pomphorhynchus laevis]
MTIELVRQGNYGKAMKRISSSRLAPFTEQTHRKLTYLHPPGKGIITSIPTAEHEFDENLNRNEFQSPVEYAVSTAQAKAESVLAKMNKSDRQCDILISADTIISLDSVIFEKPRSVEDAIKMLSRLQGRMHQVITGVCVFDNYKGTFCSFWVKTDVTMVNMGEELIKSYVETGEPMDKAGGYGIQGLGSTLISKIDGDYYNVVGLPLCRLAETLKDIIRY